MNIGYSPRLGQAIAGTLALSLLWPATAAAQDARTDAVPADADRESLGTYRAEPPDRVNLLLTDPAPEPERDTIAEEQCRRDQEAAQLSQQIIVCAEARDQSDHLLSSREEALRRRAAEMERMGEFGAPGGVSGVAGPGIFRGAPTLSGFCGLSGCPPPPAYIIDFDDLPEPDEDSDAARIARGEMRAP